MNAVYRIYVSLFYDNILLQVLKYYTYYAEITAAQYRMTCYRRLGLPLPQILEGQRCTCKREPLLDRKGIHCVTGCPRGGGRQRIHNEMNYEVAAMCKSAGLLVTIEPANAFIGLDAENRKRPDLRVQGLLEQPIYTDIQITEPCSSNLTLNLYNLSLIHI